MKLRQVDQLLENPVGFSDGGVDGASDVVSTSVRDPMRVLSHALRS